jgi:RNA polymerase sigma-70 factor, ECF subfamily
MDAQAPDTPSTDMSLLERVQQNDNNAWEKFVELYAPVVLYWCKRQGLRETDRDDVFQDVSRALLTGLRNFRKDSAQQQFRRYLWTVTRSKIQDLRRRAEQAGPLGPANVADFDRHLREIDEEEQSGNAASEIVLLRQILKQVAERITDPKRMQILDMLVIEGRSAVEVAAHFGIDPNAVRRTKARLLSMIRQEYKELLPAD